MLCRINITSARNVLNAAHVIRNVWRIYVVYISSVHFKFQEKHRVSFWEAYEEFLKDWQNFNIDEFMKPCGVILNVCHWQGKLWFLFFYQSDDCTVFFFTVGDTYKPIGFIETASPVVSIEWSKDRKVKKKNIYYWMWSFCVNFTLNGTYLLRIQTKLFFYFLHNFVFITTLHIIPIVMFSFVTRLQRAYSSAVKTAPYFMSRLLLLTNMIQARLSISPWPIWRPKSITSRVSKTNWGWAAVKFYCFVLLVRCPVVPY